MTYFYISFANGEKFLGATVIQADSVEHSIEVATANGLNPGGEAAIIEVPQDYEPTPNMLGMIGRLVSKEELVADGGKRHGDLSAEEQARFEADANIVCEDCNPVRR